MKSTRHERIRQNEWLSEIIANAVSHGLGIIFAVFALVLLTLRAEPGVPAFGVVVFGVTLILLYTNSTLYHAFPKKMGRVSNLFRRFDHVAVYLLISGTYTPFVLVLVPEFKGYLLLAALWMISILGIVFKIIWIHRFRVLHVLIFIAMGWSIFLVWKDVYNALSTTAFAFLLAGGISYTFGILFYALPVRFTHFVWHIFVLGGSILHVMSIYFIL